jgi:hypothetical protein
MEKFYSEDSMAFGICVALVVGMVMGCIVTLTIQHIRNIDR